MGWTKDARCFVIDYWRIEAHEKGEDCLELTSNVWRELRDLIENKRYRYKDQIEYGITMTFIDSNYATDTVTTFCSDYDGGVYAIMGRAKNSSLFFD